MHVPLLAHQKEAAPIPVQSAHPNACSWLHAQSMCHAWQLKVATCRPHRRRRRMSLAFAAVILQVQLVA